MAVVLRWLVIVHAFASHILSTPAAVSTPTDVCTFESNTYIDGDLITDAYGNTCSCVSGAIIGCRCLNVDGMSYTQVGNIHIGEAQGCRCVRAETQAGSNLTTGSLIRLVRCFPLAPYIPLLRKTKYFVDRDFTYDFNISLDVNQVTYGGNFFPAILADMTVVWSRLHACDFSSTPHEHPRATEYILAEPGTNLSVVIAEQQVHAMSDKSELYHSKIVGPAIVAIPQGFAHYVFNPTCEVAHTYIVLNSADPGRVGMFVPDLCTQPVNQGDPPTKDVISALLYSACVQRKQCRRHCWGE